MPERGRARRLALGAFTGVGLPNHGPGLWWHPQAGRVDLNDLDGWLDLARTLEAGGYDMLFLADAVGTYDTYRGSRAQSVRDAIGIPSNDPSVIVAALASVTSSLGFTFTSSTLQEHPFNLARKLSTLDHLTRGRVGWNVVTGYADGASRNFGLERVLEHDERYAQAEEYMEVTYRLWEHSWGDRAVVRDSVRRIHADPRHVHAINFVGSHYRVAGPHLPEPSPQRTPVLFQAGASDAGRTFAARHAEGVFLIAYDTDGARAHVEDVRARARLAARDPRDLRFFQGLWFVIGSTEEEARRREADLLDWVSIEGVLADLSGKLGVDLADVDLDRPVGDLEVPGVQGIVDALHERAGAAAGTFRDLVFHLLGARIVGTPERIVDELERWQDAGVDGINVMDVPAHGAFAEFAAHVVPVLRARGMVALEPPAPATLRARLFGAGDRINRRHPARRLPRAWSVSAP